MRAIDGQSACGSHMSFDPAAAPAENGSLIWLLRDRCHGPPIVRAVIIAMDGSSRRRIGAAMIVEEGGAAGTLGGGLLEEQVTLAARRLLASAVRCGGTWTREVISFAQGPILGEPTGGAIHVLLELFAVDELNALRRMLAHSSDGAMLARPAHSGLAPVVIDAVCVPDRRQPAALLEACRRLTAAPDASLAVVGGIPSSGTWLIERLSPARVTFHIHGTGDVAIALAQVLKGTPFEVVLHDSARDFDEAAAVDAGAYHAVMTGSHEADLEVCRRLLAADRFAFLGMIGSRTKRAGVIARLIAAGVRPEAAERISCPIGLAAVRGKEAAVIAIAIAADVIARLRRGSR